MVITKLIGGLGNQMFQYALGRRLAHLNGAELKLDLTAFIDYGLRRYGLYHFNINATEASTAEISKYRRFRIGNRRSFFPRLKLGEAVHHMSERSLGFDGNILEMRGDIYLQGYWQDPRYFVPISDVIRQEFQVITPLSEKSRQVTAMISSSPSASVHVRLGDYASDPTTRRVHGVLSRGYYAEATALVLDRFPGMHFFLFSDEPQVARDLIDLPDDCVTVVDHNDASRNFEDLSLMSLCDHHIIANSSFSWWGAWLGKNPAGVVIAPKKWVRDHPDGDTSAVPTGWIRV